jgi:hypothetical protein
MSVRGWPDVCNVIGMHRWIVLLFLPACGGGGSSDAGSDVVVGDATVGDADDAESAVADTGAPCVGLALNACKTCCTTTYLAGAKVAENAGIACACQGQYCQTQCQSTLCADAGPATGACDTCYRNVIGIAGDAGCYDEITNACSADSTCKAYQACFLSCK